MRRLPVIVACVAMLILAIAGPAQSSPLPAGCTTTPPGIAKATQNGVLGVVIAATPITCTAASGYKFVSVTIGAQIMSVSATGSVSYRNVPYRDSGVTRLPTTFFVPWQAIQPGGTPAQGYRGRIWYLLAAPGGTIINVSHFTGNVWGP